MRHLTFALILSCGTDYRLSPNKDEETFNTGIYVQAEDINCNFADVILEQSGYTVKCDSEHYILHRRGISNYLRWGNDSYLDYTNEYGYHDFMVDEFSQRDSNGTWHAKKREEITKVRNRNQIDRTYHDRLDKLGDQYAHRMWRYWLDDRW